LYKEEDVVWLLGWQRCLDLVFCSQYAQLHRFAQGGTSILLPDQRSHLYRGSSQLLLYPQQRSQCAILPPSKTNPLRLCISLAKERATLEEDSASQDSLKALPPINQTNLETIHLSPEINPPKQSTKQRNKNHPPLGIPRNIFLFISKLLYVKLQSSRNC